MGGAPRAVDEIQQAIDASVRSPLLLPLGLGLQQGQGPELKLVEVLLPKRSGATSVLGLAYHIVVLAWVQANTSFDPVLHQRHRQVGKVDDGLSRA